MESLLDQMKMEINIIKAKKVSDGLFTQKKIEATKITSDWYLWMHYTVDKIPDSRETKHSWQKNHLENQTGTSNSFKPVKIKKNAQKKKYETWK